MTFTNLVGAHRDAALENITALRDRMDALRIPANRVFAETYLGAICGRFEKVRDAGQMRRKLAQLPLDAGA